MQEKKLILVMALATFLVLGVGAYFAFQTPKGAGPASPSQRSASLSNVKQLALATLMYSTDYDDVLPPDMADLPTLKMQLYPYMKSNTLWQSHNPNGGSFQANENLSLALYNEVIAPATEVLFYDEFDWPDGRRLVAYLDGHARHVPNFDPTTDLVVEMTTKGEDFVKNAKATMALPPTSSPTTPLGMPGK